MRCTRPSSLSQTPSPQTLYIYSLTHTHPFSRSIMGTSSTRLRWTGQPTLRKKHNLFCPKVAMFVCVFRRAETVRLESKALLKHSLPRGRSQKMFRHLIRTITQILLGAEPLIWIQSQLQPQQVSLPSQALRPCIWDERDWHLSTEKKSCKQLAAFHTASFNKRFSKYLNQKINGYL